jgi:carbamoyl-phosphate synthase small subunit
MQGDPSAAPYAVDNAKAILGKKPVFGICMGHQILGQAFGGKTFKLKFGHHGGNHPIRYNPTGERFRDEGIGVWFRVWVL